MSLPTHPIWFDHLKSIWWTVQIMKLHMCKFLQSPVTYSFLGPNILLGAVFSNTLNLCSSIITRDPVSHQYISSGKIILHLTFLDSRQEDKRYQLHDTNHSRPFQTPIDLYVYELQSRYFGRLTPKSKETKTCVPYFRQC
jgi:hypothetical protein